VPAMAPPRALAALVALAAMLVLAASPAAAMGCRNEQGEPVDWWAAFKFSNSYNYAYVDADSRGGLESSPHQLSDASSGAVSHTLQQLYGGAPSYAFYNDEPPNGAKASSTFGHTKGALGFDDDSGFWLIHSTPRFPDNTPSSYQGFPANEVKYGQSFLCVSYGVGTFDDIGSLFQENRPKFYATQLDSSVKGNLPHLADAFSGTYDRSANLLTKSLQSSSGMGFTLFGKTRAWGQDLYNQGVSPYFQDDTYVESWMNGVGPLPTYCKPQYNYDTFDIRLVNITGTTLKETQDHSKWAITASQEIVCIGDINRQHGQLGRPGGTSCFQHDELWHSLKMGILSADSC